MLRGFLRLCIMQSRRQFLKQAALLSSSVGFPAIWTKYYKPKLGVALVGLGYYSTDLLAPALQLTQHCELKGIVTGTPSKIPRWQRQYGIEDSNVYSYETMPEIANNDDIDVIYIVLPTGLHSKYAVIGANTGKHIWCEKPMAKSVGECQDIINACTANRVKLSIGYRMQHEPNTRNLMRMASDRPFGRITSASAEAGYYDGRTDHWKQNKALGGGALYDMGVYCINGLRYAVGSEPVAVDSARHTTKRPEIYHEVDETTEFQLEFPDGARGQGITSLGQGFNRLHVKCASGWYTLEPFQAYSGVSGRLSNGIRLSAHPANQQARQMDNDALAIKNSQDVFVPGEEGLRDIQVVEAIYKSAATGSRVLVGG